ncbi:MAG: LysR family transcriptional regulator [Salaquimonas sp.]|jgi:molybdate transport system regulatory protein|nr:LysR family transcriptional regulator [Salaquimonas sp.]
MGTNGKHGGLHLRVTLGNGFSLGPGKADLLAGIRDTGSIAAAGRRMKMSYKRAWTLVEAMNAAFCEPLVETSRGGQARGGATLTATGERVLAGYSRMRQLTEEAVANEAAALEKLLAR